MGQSFKGAKGRPQALLNKLTGKAGSRAAGSPRKLPGHLFLSKNDFVTAPQSNVDWWLR